MDSCLVSSLGSSEYATLKYDQVEGLSTELLDKFMCFKALLRDLKAIIVDRDNFEPCKDDKIPIEVSFEVLLSVQSKLRQELLKIIEAIEVLSRDPWSHKRQMARKKWQGPQPANDFAVVVRPAAAGPNTVDPTNEVYAHSTVVGGAEQLTFDFSSLLTPDIWKGSMPINKLIGAIDANSTSRVAQSSEAMGREHKQEMDVLLVTHKSEVQEVTNNLNNVSKTLSETESKFQEATNGLKNVNKTLSDTESKYQKATNDLNNVNKTFSETERKFQKVMNELDNVKTNLRNVKEQLSGAQDKITFAEGLNNLDPACHGKSALICLRVSPHSALDFCGSLYILFGRILTLFLT